MVYSIFVTTNVAWVSMIHIKTYFIYWPSS